MTYVRARRRSLMVIAGILLIGALAGCAESIEDQQAQLERWGYDVHVVEAGNQPPTFSTTINGCKVSLIYVRDKELWTAIVKSADGSGSVLAIIQPIGTKAEFEKKQQLTAVCP